ncbi:MAG: hypothetical protein V3S48_06575 [Candidatus Neomarinimicrobiota bacterium]
MSCSSLGDIQSMETLGDIPSNYEDVEINAEYCRGQGYVISSGELSGRLNFSFTSESDTAFVQFKDLLGRKTLFLILSGDNIEAWDILHNQRYDNSSAIISLPFLEMTTSRDLRNILWGKIPFVFITDASRENSTLNGQIQFYSQLSEIGPLVSKVTFLLDDRTKIEMLITKREFNSQYPHLIKSIPESIPSAKLDRL